MQMGWKFMGRIWGVSSLFRNFLGIFSAPKILTVYSTMYVSRVHLAIFQQADTRDQSIGWLTGHCPVHPCTDLWTALFSPFGLCESVLQRKGRGRRWCCATAVWAPFGAMACGHWPGRRGHAMASDADAVRRGPRMAVHQFVVVVLGPSRGGTWAGPNGGKGAYTVGTFLSLLYEEGSVCVVCAR
jgi:hypothetical protein